jgi:hypothetical protein
MPPKQTPFQTVVEASWDAIKLPYNLAWMVVFQPINIIMWIVLDKIGNREIWGLKWLPEKKWFKESVNYGKEFRTVLTDYYNWPKSASKGGGSSCKFCPKKAEWSCIECGKRMCPQCTYNQHAPDTNTVGHSIEEILKKTEVKGVHVVSELLPELTLLLFVFHLVFRVTLVSDDYLSTQVVCPIVNGMRSVTATVDANVFFYYKNSFAGWCDTEDSFMRFLLDFWVRTIVTESDNTALVFQNLFNALLFDVILMVTVVPVFSYVYAFLLDLIYQLECYIPQSETTDLLQAYAKKIDMTGWLLRETKPRRRAEKDFIEGMKYEWSRLTRRLNYYSACCTGSLKKITWNVLRAVFALRLICINLNVAWIIRGVLRLIPFVGGFIDADKVRFAGASKTIVTEPILRKLAWTAGSLLQKFIGILPGWVYKVSFAWFCVILVVIALNSVLISKIIESRKRLKKEWANGGMKEALQFRETKTLQERPA